MPSECLGLRMMSARQGGLFGQAESVDTDFSDLKQIRMTRKNFFNAVLLQGSHTVFDGLFSEMLH